MNTPIESKSQERALTTTSFAVLAVLSLRDHSTYDLIHQMRLSMHYMWPRAESNVYAEPRRLVEAGLATAREEWNGQRRRTIYSITDAGRAALAEWIASPSARPRYENEALVKIMFAENGTREDLPEVHPRAGRRRGRGGPTTFARLPTGTPPTRASTRTDSA